ncbi:MAG: hypothetical protein ACXWPM_00465 [Bdellovibrionota bacterium]
MRWFGLLIFFFLPFHAAWSQPPSLGDWEEASSLYSSGQYDKALDAFRAHPRNNAAYYYNLAATLFHLGRIGQATAYFEKANHLEPHDPDIQHNLETARSALGRTLGADRLDPASSSMEILADRVPLDELRGILGLVGLILGFVWLRGYLRTRRFFKTLLQPSALIAGAAFLATGILFAAQRVAQAHPPAVCLDRQSVRSGPGEKYMELSQLEAGTKVRALGPVDTVANGTSTEEWRQVRFSADGIGWVRTSSLLLL